MAQIPSSDLWLSEQLDRIERLLIILALRQNGAQLYEDDENTVGQILGEALERVRSQSRGRGV
jgi:hypothetical protein